MSSASTQRNLLILLGVVRQESGTGELVLEQDDGARRFLFERGELRSMKSEVLGDQLGGADREGQFQSVQERTLSRALEHPIRRCHWIAGDGARGPEPGFKLQDRPLLWRVIQDCQDCSQLVEILDQEDQWKWEGRLDLLDSLCDLPLTPSTAFAASSFCAGPIGYQTLRAISGVDKPEAGRLIAALWAIGALRLSSGELPALAVAPATPPPAPAATMPGLILPPTVSPFGPPKRPIAKPEPTLDMPEFLYVEEDLEAGSEPSMGLQIAALIDTPPGEPMPAAKNPGLAAESPIEPGAAGIELDPKGKTVPTAPPSEADPDRAKAGRLLAQARRQLKLGRSVEAVGTLEQVVELHLDGDTAYETWMLLGGLRMRTPAWSARAIQAFQSAALIRPKDAEPLKAMAEIFRRSGAAADAEACEQRIRELDPSSGGPKSGKR